MLISAVERNNSSLHIYGTSQVAPVAKNPPANAGDIREAGLIPGLGRSPGGGHGNPLWYACLENPMDRGAWWTGPQGHSGTRLKQLGRHAHMYTFRTFSLWSIPGEGL